MATSGLRTFNPTFAEIMTEAFARIGIRPLTITQEHIDEAIRSANLMLIEFAARGVNQFQLVQTTQALAVADATYDLPAGTIDVWSCIYRHTDGTDTPMWPMSRTDYEYMPDKDNAGRPFHYFVERGAVGNTVRTITLWPVPDAAHAGSVVLWVWRRAEDATGIPETLSTAWEWFDAYAAKLCARMAEKFAPALTEEKSVLGEQAFMLARGFDRERAPARFRMTGYTRGRRY